MSGWLRFRISVAVRAQSVRALCAFRLMAAGSVRFLALGQWVFG